MKGLRISKGLKWNRKKYFYLILIIFCMILYAFAFVGYTEAGTGGSLNHRFWFVIWISSIIMLYFSMVIGQKIFLLVIDDDFKNKPAAATERTYFIPRNGFKRPLIYFFPYLASLLYLSYTAYIFIPWIRHGMIHFNYLESQLYTHLFAWIIFTPLTIAYPLNHYLALSTFIDFQSDLVIIRHRFRIFYIPYKCLNEVIIYTRSGGWHVVYFLPEGHKSIPLNMRFLRPFSKDIKRNIDALYSGKVNSLAKQRMSNPLTMSSRASGQRVSSSRGRW